MKKTLILLGLFFSLSAAAVQVLYTAEGDSVGATDLLTGDGSQDGVFTHTFSNNTKSATTDVFVGTPAKHGESSYGFLRTASYINTIDMQGVTHLGSSFTLAAFVRPAVSPNSTRLFSTWNGAGGLANQLLCDYGSSVRGFRLAVNGIAVQPSAGQEPSIPTGSFTHLAATYDDGAVILYVNGLEVARGAAGSGAPTIDNNDGRRLQVGQNWRWSPTAGNTGQSTGQIDDILIYDRALSSNEIVRLSRVGAMEFFYPDGVLYTAEGDSTHATDRLTNRLVQNGVFGSGVTVRTDSPKFGKRAYYFADADGASGLTETNVIVMPHTKKLGERFTLAAYVRFEKDALQRLFAAYPSSGSDLLMDFDPDAAQFGFNARFYCCGSAVMADADFTTGEYHHFAATFDRGETRLYMDGTQIAIGTNAVKNIILGEDLRIGADKSTAIGTRLHGYVDDVVLLYDALSADEIQAIATNGAQAVLAPFPKGTLIRVK